MYSTGIHSGLSFSHRGHKRSLGSVSRFRHRVPNLRRVQIHAAGSQRASGTICTGIGRAQKKGGSYFHKPTRAYLMCVFCHVNLIFGLRTLNVFSWRNLRRKSPSWKSAIAPSLVVWKTVKLWQMARRGQETIHVKYAPVM